MNWTREVVESILLGGKKKNANHDYPQIIGYSQIIPLSNRAKNLRDVSKTIKKIRFKFDERTKNWILENWK